MPPERIHADSHDLVYFSYVTALEDRIERFERLFKRVSKNSFQTTAFRNLLMAFRFSCDQKLTLLTFLDRPSPEELGRANVIPVGLEATQPLTERMEEVPNEQHRPLFLLFYRNQLFRH